MDWESDPELRKMREEYVDSLAVRLGHLRRFLGVLPSLKGDAAEKVIFEIRVIAHNLAGTAGNFGFPVLEDIAAALDDYVAETKPAANDLLPHARFLEHALELASSRRADPAELAEDPRYERILELNRPPG